MIWNQHLLYQIIDVWYHIRKLYLINNEKNDKIKLNHFFLQTAPHRYFMVCNRTNDSLFCISFVLGMKYCKSFLKVTALVENNLNHLNLLWKNGNKWADLSFS